MKVTADTITDAQIRELRRHAVFVVPNETHRALADVALGTNCVADPSARMTARARCAEILNARTEAK